MSIYDKKISELKKIAESAAKEKQESAQKQSANKSVDFGANYRAYKEQQEQKKSQYDFQRPKTQVETKAKPKVFAENYQSPEQRWEQFRTTRREFETRHGSNVWKMRYDFAAGQKEIDDLEAELTRLRMEKLAQGPGVNSRPYAAGQSAVDEAQYTTGYGITNNRPYAAGQQAQREIEPTDDRIRELEMQISKKKQDFNLAKQYQKEVAYDDTVKNADFDQYDDYVESDDTLYNWINNPQFRESYEASYQSIPNPNARRSKYTRKGYDRMSASEIAIFNYYYAKSGKEAAQKYLDTIQERLNERIAEEMYSTVQDNTAAKIVFGAAVGLSQFGSDVKNFFNTEDDYIAQTAYQLAGGMVREDLADEGKKIGLLGGVSLGQIAYDTVSTAANMAPSILASYAVGAAAGTLGLSAKTAQAVGSYTGSAMMGISAAGGAYQQALNEGFDKDQARGYGILVGASEVVMEKFLGGISAVGGNALGINMTKNIANADTALKAIAKRLGGSMISEFGEEYLQEVLDPVFSNIMLKTDKEVKPISAEAIYSGILGMLTGAIMEAPSAIYGETKTAITGRKLKEAGGVDSLAKIGNTFAADTVAYKLAGKVNENTGAYTIGQLLKEVDATLTEQNVNEIAEALMKEGIGEIAAKKYAQAFAYVVEGGAMPDSLVNAIEADTLLAKAAREVLIDQNTTWNQRTQGYNEVLKKLAMDKVTGKKSAKAAPANDQQMTGKSTAEESTVVEKADKSRAETAAAPKVSKIQTVEKGKTTVKLDDGTEVELKDAALDPEDSVRIETIANVDGMTAEDASNIYSILKAADGRSAQMDALGAKEAYQYGYYGLPESQLTEHAAFANSLTETQRKAVYEIGQKARQKKVENTTFKKSGAPKVAGKVHFDGDRSALNERQQVSLKTMDRIAEVLGVQIYVFESKVGKNGKRIGENGWYDPKDGSIHIDLYAGATGEATMLFTLAHELTHYIRQWSPQKFKVLADFLMEEYGKKGVRIESLIREQQNKAKRNGRTISYDTAYEEVVADSMEMMLSDGNVMKRLEKLKAQDKDLWSQIKRFVDNMAAKIREVYKGLKPDSKEAELVMEMGDAIYRLQELFTEGLVEASENFQSAEKNTTDDAAKVNEKTAESVDISFDEASESVAPSVLYSERTWTESDYVKERDAAAKEIAKAIGVTEKKAKDYIDSVNSIAKMIADDRTRLDYFSSPNRSSFVSNVEYGGSFDFSTLCKKRRLLTGTFTAIQKALPNTALTANEILDIRNRMKDAGLEVSCGLCYVEGSRANMGQFAKEFLRLYKQYYPDAWQPNMADVNTPDGIEWVRINHPECYEQYEYFWNHYGTLKAGDKNLFASQQKPKLYQLHTEYKGEILKKFKDDDNVEEKNLNGGIRLQSFSDFEIVHLIDTMQIIMDMSRVGLAGQAYTKVPDFAWALGDTGLKINLSLIAKGVDENGKLIFDDVEGMPIKDAMKLRDRYSKNVGTILVAFNDDQLKAAMADERVDFIIPFHRSQWKKSQYSAMGLPAKTKDYTFMQNEKFIKPQYHEYRGRMVKDKATNYMPNEYWDFSKSGKENAEAYLQMCARNNKRPKFYKLLQNNGDGSYSLKADGSTDGYWKLLIDFKMYDNAGNGSPQQAVKPEFNMDEATRMLNEYSGGHSNFPVAQGIVDEFVSEYKDSHKGALYSSRDFNDAANRAVEQFGTTKDFNEAGFILPDGKMIRLTDNRHKGERQYDHRAIGMAYGVDVDLGVNHGFNMESGKYLDDFVEHGGIRFDAGDPDLDMDIGLQLSSTVPLTKEQENIIRDLVEWKIDREEKFEANLTEENFLYRGPLAIRIDFGGNSNYAVGAVSKKDLSAWGKKSLEYNGREINANRIIADIRNYYRTGETRESSLISQFHYSDRDTESVSNRSLLANAMESLAKTELEKKKLTEYKAKIDQINAEEQKLSEVRAQIKELSFAKGPRDKEKLRALRDEAIKLSHHIGIYDKQLLRLEASKPLQNVLDREKAKAYQRGKEKGEAALEAYKLKTEVKQSESLRDYREAARAANREQRNDFRIMEKEFIRIAKEYEKLTAKSSNDSAKGKKTISALREALKDEIKTHKKDQKMWEMEFARLLREYDAADRSITRLEEKIERQRNTARERVENRNKTAMRHKIQNVVKELNSLLLTNDKKRRVPDNLKKAVAAALDLVNMDTVDAENRAAKYADLIAKEQAKANPDQDKIDSYTMTMENILRQGEKIGQRIKELHAAYEEIQNSDDPDIANAYDPVISGAIQELSATIGNTSIKNMTMEQLSDVYDVYRAVLTRVRDANKAMAENIRASIEELAKSTIREVKTVGGSKKYRISNLDAVRKFDWNNMKPVYAMERIGSSTLTEVFNNVRAGEDIWAKDVSEAREYYLEKSKKYGYDKWDFDKKYRFESNSGIPFELTLKQILSLYAYSKREQAADHLRLGGFVFDSNIETYKEKDGKKSLLKYKVNTADAHQITPEIMADIIGKLSKEQTGFVDEMQDYLSTVMGAKGNEVTSKMYGVKLFKEKFYFPLKSAKQFMFEQNEVSGEVRIKNSGFTNKVVAKANNPVILSNFMDVWSGHVNDMSMYHAFTLPLEDFNRVFNYNSPKKDGVESVSVKGTIQDAYSPAAVSYVKQLITDLNGGARTDSTTGVINKLTGMFKKGAVFASLSVVVQQPSAIARAAALVDTKYFIGPKVDQKRHKYLWAEVKKYAPVAIIKEMGYFDTNVGKSTQDFITGKEYSGIGEKAKAVVTDSTYRDELLSKAPALADEYAWCGIWAAVKRETKAKHPSMDTTSEAFLKLCGKRFTEVITKTQVYDSVLARSANMRSKDTGMKMATAFMAEPTTSINMIEDAIWKAKRGDKKYAGKAIGAVVASQILNAILVSFVYAGRDDDEDETYAEKYISALTGSLVDGLNVATYIPFIKDIVSIMQGYDVERSDMAVVSDLWNAWKNLKNDKVSPYRKVENFAGSIAQIFGLPVKNIMRDVRGIYNTITNLAGAEQTTGAGVKYAISGAITGKTVSDKEQLYKARLDGDKQHAARVAARYDDEDSADAAVRAAIKDSFMADEIDEATALKHMVLYAGMDGSEAHWTMDAWKYRKKVGSDEGYGKYGKFHDAVRSGKNLESVIKEYTDNGVKASTLTGEITEEFKPVYLEASNSEKAAMKTNLISAYVACDMEREDAEKKLESWDFEAEYGFAYSDRKETYLSGKVSKATLVDILIDHGYDEEDAEAQVEAYEWEAAGFEDVTTSAIRNYNEWCEPVGIPKSVYLEFWRFDNSTENDVDKTTGKPISYSAVKKIMAYINSLNLTDRQKDALAKSTGWADKTIKKYKLW